MPRCGRFAWQGSARAASQGRNADLLAAAPPPFSLYPKQQLSNVDTWLTEWKASEEQARALFKQLASILKANGKR